MALFEQIQDLREVAASPQGALEQYAEHLENQGPPDEVGGAGPAEPKTVPVAKAKKYDDTVLGRLAGHSHFENFTISVICLNALWIGYDTEYTATIGKPDNLYHRETPPEFIVMENFFAVFFTFEMAIRAISYRDKSQCWKDAWFVFDSCLVILMIVETWIMPATGGGGLGGLGVLRLLRLLRITRMAKLMRAIPEIMLIVKGLGSATRAVATTAILMILITYTFAIVFTNHYHQGIVLDGDEPDNAMVNFGTMGKSVFSLLIMGAIFDDLTYCTDSIRESGSTIMLFVFVVYMLLTGFTVLNMLVGILAEVVQATSEGEEHKADLALLTESLGSIISQLDEDGDKKIFKGEFIRMKTHPDLKDSLAALQISKEDFDKYGELVFSAAEDKGEEPSLSYQELAHIIFKLRPGQRVSALDLACFEHGMLGMLNAMNAKFRKLDKIASVIANGSKPESVGMLLRSSTFNTPSPKSRLTDFNDPASGTATPNSLLSQSSTEIADITEMPVADARRDKLKSSSGSTRARTSRVKFFDDAPSSPPQALSLAAKSGRAAGAGPSTVDDPLWRSLASADIIREVQRRLTGTDSREAGLARRKKDESAAAHEAIATLGVPALPGEICSRG